MKFSKIAISFTLLASMLGSTAFAAPPLTTPSNGPEVKTLAIEAAQARDNARDYDIKDGKDWGYERNRDKDHSRDGYGHSADTAIETTAVKATVAGADVSGTIKGRTATLKMPVSGALSMIKIEGTDGVTLTVDKIKGIGDKVLTKEMVFTDMHQISVADILGNPANESIDVASLRAALGDSDKLVVSGTLTKDDYKSKKVRLVLDFSKTEGQYSNSFIDATRDGRTVDVSIKQPDALISAIGMKNMILGVSQSAKILPTSVSLGEGEDKVTYTRLLDPATQDAIRDKIGDICGTWTTATLSDLVEKSDELNMKLNNFTGKSIKVIFTEM